MRSSLFVAVFTLATGATGALATATLAQDRAPRDMSAAGEDCAFLTRAFAETYRGIREEEGKMDEADPLNVIMYLNIQSNTIDLAEAAGCDVRPMVEIAKRQLRRYDGEPQGAMRQDGAKGEMRRGAEADGKADRADRRD